MVLDKSEVNILLNEIVLYKEIRESIGLAGRDAHLK